MCLDRKLRALTLQVILGGIKDSTSLREELIKVIEDETGISMTDSDRIRATHMVDELFTDWRRQKELNEEVAKDYIENHQDKGPAELFKLLKKKYDENGLYLSWDNIKRTARGMGIEIEGEDDVSEGDNEG
jgi:hypothetical protein